MSTAEEMVRADQVSDRALPDQPFRVDITGQHGRVVELDPRRVRPLDNNPRAADNPGFSKNSIVNLSDGIRAIDQQEDAKVVPLIGDPDYDAQLIDGERRLRACLHACLSFKAKVREDIDPKDTDALFLAAVACNSAKEQHTTTELVQIVFRMRGMNMTNKDIGLYIGKHETYVSQLYRATELHADVVKLLSNGLVLQTALQLRSFTPEQQSKYAKKIVKQKMGDAKARRFIMNLERDHDVKPVVRRGRRKRQFDSLVKLAETSDDKFGIFLDMRPAEIAHMVENIGSAERSRAVESMRLLASCLESIANMIEPEKK